MYSQELRRIQTKATDNEYVDNGLEREAVAGWGDRPGTGSARKSTRAGTVGPQKNKLVHRPLSESMKKRSGRRPGCACKTPGVQMIRTPRAVHARASFYASARVLKRATPRAVRLQSI